MADIIFSNNASALLAASITPATTVIQVAAGFGVNFPSPGGAQYFVLALEDDAGNIEIMHCTSRATDLLTVIRAQEGTTALSFTLTVTRCELRLTKGTVEAFVQVSGDSMSGDLNMVTNEIQNAELTGTTIITGGQSVGMSIRGTLGQTDNEVVVPAGSGVRATAGGVPIVVNTDDIIALLDTAGLISLASATVGVDIPAGAYLELQGVTAANKMRISHDDTDLNIVLSNTTDANWSGAPLNMLANLKLNDNALERPFFNDWAMQAQTVSGVASTTIDYELGQYVTLNLTADITTLTLSNPPLTARFGALRIKVVQDATARTIAWPASVKWTGGAAPTLSTGSGDIDFIDLWTDDAGVTWYGAFLLTYS